MKGPTSLQSKMIQLMNFFSCIAGRVRDIVGQQRDENKNDQNSLGSEQENTTKSQTNTTNQTPKTRTQARSLSCLGKCKLGETSETCAPLSAPQKFSSTSMYFSICPVLNVSHVNICHHVLRRIPDIRLQALSLDLIRAFACLPLFRTILQKEIDFRLCSTFFVVKCLQ